MPVPVNILMHIAVCFSLCDGSGVVNPCLCLESSGELAHTHLPVMANWGQHLPVQIT